MLMVNVDKAIKLLEKASEQNFLPSDFFLFMIFSYGNTFHENKEKSNDHGKNIMERKFSNVMTIFYLYPKQTHRIFNFIKDFDFIYALNADYEEFFFNHLCNVIVDERYIVPYYLQELNENTFQEIKEIFLKK